MRHQYTRVTLEPKRRVTTSRTRCPYRAVGFGQIHVHVWGEPGHLIACIICESEDETATVVASERQAARVASELAHLH